MDYAMDKHSRNIPYALDGGGPELVTFGLEAGGCDVVGGCESVGCTAWTVEGWMDRWEGEWVDGWVGGWMDGWTDGSMNG